MDYKIRHILVPTDFSEAANNALRVAIGMAELHKASLHLLHVLEPLYVASIPVANDSIVNIDCSSLDIATDLLSKRKQQILSEYNFLTVFTETAIGGIPYFVDSYVRKNNISITVMGTHGISGFREYFIGSNTYNIIKQVACPVLSIPLSFKGEEFNSILFPVRNIEGVVEKYDYLKPIKEKNEASIHLLGVAFENDKEEMYLLAEKLNAVQDFFHHSIDKISFEIVQTSDIAQKIIDVANNRMDDLMIINATLDKKWYQFFNGTYTQKVINNSKIPVLSVKPKLTPELTKMIKRLMAVQANYHFPLSNLADKALSKTQEE